METQTQTQTPDEDSLREWTIGICVTLLALFASWIVFGDDLMHLVQPPPPTTPTAITTAKPGD